MFKREILLLIATFCFICFLAGITSRVYLGDENYHFRLARVFFETGARPAADLVYKNVPALGYNFAEAPLWHIILAFVWKVSGGVSRAAAQIYQVFYAFLLLASVYFIAKHFYGKKEALFAVILSCTAPIISVFSIILYIDMPLTALLSLCFLFIYKERYLLAGLVLGCAILTKINAFFMVPAMLAIILFNSFKENRMKAGLNIFLFSISAFILNIPDILFRLRKLGYLYYITPRPAKNISVSSYSHSALNNNPFLIILYFGIPLLGLIAGYFIFRRYEKKDIGLWLPVISYLIFWFIFFNHVLDVRYLIAIIPFLAILSAKPLCLKGRKFIILIIILAFIQCAAAISYVWYKRQIPLGISKGYAYVNMNLKKSAVIMYPGEDMVTYTGRPIAWGRVARIAELFWGNDEKDMLGVLREYGIEYIAVKKDRIYDDSKIRKISGYPDSFIKKIPGLSFLKKLYENEDFSLWEVKYP